MDAAKVMLIVVWGLVLAMVGGWIANIVKLMHMADFMTGWGVARIAGIFVAPLGSVLGFF